MIFHLEKSYLIISGFICFHFEINDIICSYTFSKYTLIMTITQARIKIFGLWDKIMNRKMLGNNPRYDRKPSSCVIRKLKSGGVKSEGVLFYWTPQNVNGLKI